MNKSKFYKRIPTLKSSDAHKNLIVLPYSHFDFDKGRQTQKFKESCITF